MSGGLKPDNLISPEQARRLGIQIGPPAASPARKAPKLKTKARPKPPSIDGRRPWIDTILRRSSWKWRIEPEQQISADLADMLVKAEIEGRARVIFHHVANEGRRSHAVGGLLKHIGMFPGAPDWWFMGQPWGAGLIELKAPGGKMSEAQDHYAAWCAHHGIRHAVCWSAQSAWKTLVEWGAMVDG